MPQPDIEQVTRRAFGAGLSDAERVAALAPLKGYGTGGPFTSVPLTAWDPTKFGVFDQLAHDRHLAVVHETCTCEWSDLPTYWARLRTLSHELGATRTDGTQVKWIRRRVDMALMNLPPPTARPPQ